MNLAYLELTITQIGESWPHFHKFALSTLPTATHIYICRVSTNDIAYTLELFLLEHKQNSSLTGLHCLSLEHNIIRHENFKTPLLASFTRLALKNLVIPKGRN